MMAAGGEMATENDKKTAHVKNMVRKCRNFEKYFV
jgi:hypothetical protein